jgi:hypothetical protein
LHIAGAIACAMAFSGCASIVGGTEQVISVQTTLGAYAVSGASCKLDNNKGTWSVRTPGSVTVHRSYDDLNVRCEKDGVEPGITAVKSSTKGMAYGNIIAGGIIGAAVDMGTGAAYDYPGLISVDMGIGKSSLQRPDSAPQAMSSAGAVSASTAAK